MDLTGNVNEPTVTLGNSAGRAFTGTHGDGVLTTTASFEGNATNTDWPGINATTARGVTASSGNMIRGGNYNSSDGFFVSERSSTTCSTRACGIRLGRTAP